MSKFVSKEDIKKFKDLSQKRREAVLKRWTPEAKIQQSEIMKEVHRKRRELSTD